jgi:hypothetical protein
MFMAWLRGAVTDYCLEYRGYPAERRQTIVADLSGFVLSEAGVNGFAELVTDSRWSKLAVDAADVIAGGVALLALDNRDLASAEAGTPEHLADVHVFGESFNAAALIRDRCDRLAAETEQECELRAGGYVEPDWDQLADAYVDGSHEWVIGAFRHALTGGPLWGCQIADLFGDDPGDVEPVSAAA